jgi:hypothetical protein
MTNWSSLKAIAWSLVFAVTAVGCNSGSDVVDPCATALRVNLEVGDGAVIDEVSYEISGNGLAEPVTGTINTSAPGSTASVEEFGLPPGDGYVIEMIATSVDGTLTCGGAASFSVSAGASTQIDVILNCKASQQFGGVRVNGKLNICAELQKVVVAPLQTASGYALEVQAQASDEEDDPIAYLWTATGGSFDDPNAAQTIFTCGDAGEEAITIEVSDDGHEYCSDGWTIDVTCVDDEGTGGTGGSGGSSGTGGTAGSGGAGGVGGVGGGTGGSGGAGGVGGVGGGTGGSGGAGGVGGVGGGTGGSGGAGGTGGNGTGGTGGNGTGGTGGNGTGGTGGNGTGGTGGNGTGGNGTGGNGTGGNGATGGSNECLVTVSIQ